MKNIYRKIAVTSVCTALGFALGASEEAKAAKFTLTAATKFFIEDRESIYAPPGFMDFGDGLPDRLLNSRYDNEFGVFYQGNTPDSYRFASVAREVDKERRAFYEFNIGNLSLAPNTVIKSAIFQQGVYDAQNMSGYSYRFKDLYLQVFGYVGNGKPDISDFGTGVNLGEHNAVYNGNFNFDVTRFVNERVSNRDAFAGLGIRLQKHPIDFFNLGVATLDDSGPSLTIETVDVAEPVPEPTTIFGSALALGVGGWLKRKKSTQQNKTTPQN